MGTSARSILKSVAVERQTSEGGTPLVVVTETWTFVPAAGGQEAAPILEPNPYTHLLEGEHEPDNPTQA